jgi:hypothetical protein
MAYSDDISEMLKLLGELFAQGIWGNFYPFRKIVKSGRTAKTS